MLDVNGAINFVALDRKSTRTILSYKNRLNGQDD
jgi:hypothetical protein